MHRVVPALFLLDPLNLCGVVRRDHLFELSARIREPAEVQARAGQHHFGDQWRGGAVHPLVQPMQIV